MDNNELIFIAVIAGFVNLILSVLVPCAFKQTQGDLLSNVRKVYDNNREMLLTSSILVVVMVFIALKAAPIAREELPQGLVNLASLRF